MVRIKSRGGDIERVHHSLMLSIAGDRYPIGGGGVCVWCTTTILNQNRKSTFSLIQIPSGKLMRQIYIVQILINSIRFFRYKVGMGWREVEEICNNYYQPHIKKLRTDYTFMDRINYRECVGVNTLMNVLTRIRHSRIASFS